MNFEQSSTNLFKICVLGSCVLLGAAWSASADNLEGQHSVDDIGTPSGVWTTGNLRNWKELQYIPCRETLDAGPVTNKVFTVSFPHASGGKPGIQSLTSIGSSTNVQIVNVVLTQNGDTWTYTFTVNITNNQTGYVTFFARMRAGAHNFPGSSLKLESPPLQIHKPAAGPGTPNLVVKKVGPAIAQPGQVITYTLYYTNVATGLNPATGVQLTDVFPTNALSYVEGSASGGGLSAGNTVSWDLPNVAVGASGFVTFQALVKTNFVGTFFTNSSQILSSEDDGDYSDNISTAITLLQFNTLPVANADFYTNTANALLTVPASGVLANDTDANGDSLTAVVVSTTSHGALTLNTNGSFTYQPATDYVGTDTFTYRANDGKTNSNIATVTITVTGIPLVVVTPPVNQTNCPGTTAVFSEVATGTGVGYQWYFGGTLLVGETNGTLSLGNIGLSNAGTYSVVATGAVGGPLTNSATLTVNTNVVVSQPPVGSTNCVGSEASFVVGASGTQLSYQWYFGDTLLSGQTNATLSLGNVGSSNAGTYNVVVSGACGNAVTNSATLTVNEPVVITGAPTNQTSVVGSNVVFNVGATGSGLSYQWYFNDVLVGTNSSYEIGAVTTNNAGTYCSVVSGACGNPATNCVTLTISNRAPVGVADTYNATEDTLLTVPSLTGVLSNDSDADGSGLTASLVANVNHGTLTLNSDGSFSYQPASNYNGSDSFTYQANDGSTNSGVITVTISIGAVNDVPVAVADVYAATEDTLLTISAPGVLNNDSDVEGSPLTAVLVSGVSQGTLTFNTNGSFTYLPATNYNGSDSFSYKANDGAVSSATVSVTINVGSANDAPTVNIITPTNNAVFVAGQNTTIVADAFDSDGSITNVQFFVGTNQLFSTTNAPYFFVWTNLVEGIYQLTAVGTDNEGLSVTSSVVTISVMEKLALTYIGPIVYDGQVNLFKQVVRVSNPTPTTLPAARVLVFGLATGAKVFNANGTNGGIPFVQFNQLIAPGATAELTIEYYVLNRVAPTPILVVELVPTFTPVTLTGTAQPITRSLQFFSNKTFLLEFASILNRAYAVQYSSNLVNWATVVPTLLGNGSQIQWIDNGAPKTESAPAVTEKRFYRIILLP